MIRRAFRFCLDVLTFIGVLIFLWLLIRIWHCWYTTMSRV